MIIGVNKMVKKEPRESRATSDSEMSSSRSNSEALCFFLLFLTPAFLVAFLAFLALFAASWSYFFFQNSSSAYEKSAKVWVKTKTSKDKGKMNEFGGLPLEPVLLCRKG